MFIAQFIKVWIVVLLTMFTMSCSKDNSRTIQKEVELLVGEPGLMADQAEQSLVARGLTAIPVLETGLYIGNAQGRKKIIRVLKNIGDPEGLPIIEFVAREDKESHVRDYASRVLKQWPGRDNLQR